MEEINSRKRIFSVQQGWACNRNNPNILSGTMEKFWQMPLSTNQLDLLSTFYVPATMGTEGSFIPFFFSFFFLTMAHLKNTFFFFFAMPCIMWDLNSPTRIKSAPPAEEVWRLNHETTREVPGLSLLKASHRLVPQEKAPDHRLVFTSFTHQPHVPFQSHIWRSPL